ncbi:hypothetical protein ACIQTZ_19810 [Paenarthrobacter sp. NPDC090520]|uniref:hypothetical protein n=1 Tax=Paenarthrobacter sp. NPDC090520 TaxID=3364382 RepID=UPI00380F74E6
MSRDQLHVSVWAAAAIFVVAVGIVRPRRFHWTALTSILLFAALNTGAGVYVLNHYSDPRWSEVASTQLSAPSLAETPLVGQFMGPLDSALKAVVTGVNDFMSFKAALPVALDFLGAAGWALLISFPVGVLVAAINFVVGKRRTAGFEKYRATVDLLKDEVEKLKLHIQGTPGSADLLGLTEQETQSILSSTQTSPTTRLP